MFLSLQSLIQRSSIASTLIFVVCATAIQEQRYELSLEELETVLW